jgi:predicted amidohydrolase YtcJ
MRADLAVLDRNFFAEGAQPVASARVEWTIAAGELVYERPS